jgi:hypothetical protein
MWRIAVRALYLVAANHFRRRTSFDIVFVDSNSIPDPGIQVCMAAGTVFLTVTRHLVWRRRFLRDPEHSNQII